MSDHWNILKLHWNCTRWGWRVSMEWWSQIWRSMGTQQDSYQLIPVVRTLCPWSHASQSGLFSSFFWVGFSHILWQLKAERWSQADSSATKGWKSFPMHVKSCKRGYSSEFTLWCVVNRLNLCQNLARMHGTGLFTWVVSALVAEIKWLWSPIS